VSRFAVAWSCAFARLRARPLRNAVAALAVAATVTSLILVTLIANVSGPESIRQTIAHLPVDERALTVAYAPTNSPSKERVRELDAAMHSRLRLNGLLGTTSVVEYRALAIGTGGGFRLIGIDDIDRQVELVSGRLPRTCAASCEVVVLNREPMPVATRALRFDPRYKVIVVGEVRSRSKGLLSGQLAPDPDQTIVFANDVADAAAFEPFKLYQKIFGWQAPIDPSTASRRTIGSLYAATGRINRLPDIEGVRATFPDTVLRQSVTRSQSADNRLAYPRAMAFILGIGMAALIGFGMRTDHQRAVVLLRRRSADPLVVFGFRLIETLVPILTGTAAALLLCIRFGPRLAKSLVGSPLPLGWRDLVTVHDWRLLGVALAVCACVTLIAMTVDDRQPTGRFGATDVSGMASFIAIGLLLNRSTDRAAGPARFDPMVVALPLLAALFISAVAVRLAPPVMGGLAMALRRRPLLRVGVVDSLRQPWRPHATLCLLTTTVMFATVAVGYRSTLALGAEDQSAFVVPYDARIAIGPSLVRPRTLEPAGGWASLAPGSVVTDVVRRGATVRGGGTISNTIELLGLDPATLSALRGWRPSFGRQPLSFATKLVRPVSEPGTELPPGTRAVRLTGTGFAGLAVSVITTHSDGLWREVETTGGSDYRVATFDDGGGPASPAERIVGFRIAVPSSSARLIEHHIGEGLTSESATPYDVRVTHVDVVATNGDRAPVALDWSAWRSTRADVTLDGVSVRAAGLLLGQSAIVSVDTGQFAEPIPAIVDPETYGLTSGGIVWIDAGQGRVPLRPVGSVRAFPSVLNRFAVTDAALLQPALDLIEPGLGTANEVWIGHPVAGSGQVDTPSNGRAARDQPASIRAAELGRALADTRFADVTIGLRAEEQAQRSRDPLSRATLAILLLSSLTALMLAALFLQLSTASDRVDDRDLHRSLALQGVRPSDLVRLLLNKSLSVLPLALPLGLLGGMWLLHRTTKVLVTGVDGGIPHPELRVSLPWVVLTEVGAVFVFASVLLCWTVARPLRYLGDEDLLRGTQ
jgi:hypothetical protein